MSDRPLRVLFLQGPPTGFWRELAGTFEAGGHAALKVNLCTADALFWRRRARAYRGRFSRWRGWIARLLAEERIDAVLYYADRLPYHVVAAEEAARLGVPAYAVEFGYLRPDWLTLERGGMGAFSHLPDDPAVWRALAAEAPAPASEARFGHSFLHEAASDVAFHLANALLAPPYPFYRLDKPVHPLIDYPSWLPRLWRGDREAAFAEAVTREAEAGAAPFHLFALQLQSDYQIRDNAPFDDLGEMIEAVVASFARAAAPERRLIVKLHPLDNGLFDWPGAVRRAAARHGVEGRVTTIDGGRLDALIRHAGGVVVANSTVGLHAIRAGAPVAALGEAVYAMSGLTHQGPLDGFWEAPAPVDAALARDFVRALAATAQVRGSFYHPEGRRLAAAEIVRRVAAGGVQAGAAYVDPPPRLPVSARHHA